jgi:mono/diheme cytochrome c family protein
MTTMERLCGLLTVVLVSGWPLATIRAADDATPLRSVWSGVFSTEQAARGKAQFAVLCQHCHSPLLTGSQAGPPLRGPGFWKKWEGDTVWALFVKIRDYMPEDTIESVTDEEKLDVLTHILVSNGVVPSAAADLPLDRQVLDRIVITKDRAAAATAGNFWEVRAEGCLVRRPGGRWGVEQARATLLASNAPVAGPSSFTLYNVAPTVPEGRAGTVVHAQGLLFREPGGDRLSVTSLDVTGRSCAP